MTLPWDGLAIERRAAVWQSLSPAERAELIGREARAISWVDGLPVAVRDEAGRAALTAAMRAADTRRAELEAAVSAPTWTGRPGDGVTLTELEQAVRRAAELHKLCDLLDRPVGIAVQQASVAARIQVLGVDLDRDLIAFGVGDLDHAGQVSVLVPGTGVGVKDTEKWLRHASDEIRLTQEADPSRTVAAVVWKYGTPGLATMGFAGAAHQAAPRLADFVRGLREQNPGADLDVVAHSYGCLVMTEAAAHHDLYPAADRLFGLACPGTLVNRLEDLHVPAERIYFSTAPNDIVRSTGLLREILTNDTLALARRFVTGDGPLWYGPNPADPAFGAQVIPTELRGSYTLADMLRAHSQPLDPTSAEASARGRFHATPAADFCAVPERDSPDVAALPTGPAQPTETTGDEALGLPEPGLVPGGSGRLDEDAFGLDDWRSAGWEAPVPSAPAQDTADSSAPFLPGGGDFGGGGASGDWDPPDHASDQPNIPDSHQETDSVEPQIMIFPEERPSSEEAAWWTTVVDSPPASDTPRLEPDLSADTVYPDPPAPVHDVATDPAPTTQTPEPGYDSGPGSSPWDAP